MFTDSVACPRDPFSPYLLALLAVPCCRMPFLLTGRALVNAQSTIGQCSAKLSSDNDSDSV